MAFIFFLVAAGTLAAVLWRPISLWYKRNRCPKCGQWHCLKFVGEVVTDKAVGHDRTHTGTGGGRYGGGFLGGLHTSHSMDHPFIRYWVQERYICQKCGRRVAVNTYKDKR